MNWPHDCAAIIPCHNEERTISALVQSVRQFLPTVFVIDDASTDRTAEEAREAGAQIDHSYQRGKGASLRAGLARANASGFQWALLLDGDGQHDPAEIPRFLLEAESNEADLVIGNRMDGAAAMPLVRRLVNRWMSRRISRQVGFNCPDSQCGFRLVRLSALKHITLESECFEIESEMLIKFAGAGLRIRFVPISVKPSQRPSRIRPIGDTIRWFRWWFSAKL